MVACSPYRGWEHTPMTTRGASIDPAFQDVVDKALRYAEAEGHREPYVKAEVPFCFKFLQSDDPRSWLHAGSEILTVRTGVELDLPVSRLLLMNHAPVLVGPKLTDLSLRESPDAVITNEDELWALATFEEFVMNRQDSAEHLRILTQSEGGGKVEAVDHGHTFHVDYLDEERDRVFDLPRWPPVYRSVTTRDYDYRVRLWQHLDPSIELIQDLEDAQLQTLVDGVCDDLRAVAERTNCQDALPNLELHGEIWRRILEIRRDYIWWIMAERFAGISPLAAH